MRYECLSCGGIYETPQGDYEYFHTCPKVRFDAKRKKVPIENPRDERAPRGLHSVQEGDFKSWYLVNELVATLQKGLNPDIFTKEGKGRKVVEGL